jgi:hypothetical protein
MVTLAGYGGDYPPTDAEGYLRFGEGLRTPLFVQEVSRAKPLGPIVGNRSAQNRVRHFERLTRWPENLVAVGDSVCGFNPIYGQGMTVAAPGGPRPAALA